MFVPSKRQMEIMKHTLGLTRKDAPYRNHFVVSPGDTDLPDLLILEKEGLMYRAAGPAWINEKDVLFMVNNEGKALCKGTRR